MLGTIFPIAIMCEMFVASVVCLCVGDYPHALYWFAGGVLNLAVIFLM